MTHMITAAAMAELEERCMHEFFELALSNAMVENLCLTIAFLVERLGGLDRVPYIYHHAAAEAVAAVDVLSVRDIQWFPDADIGSRT